MNNDQKIQQLEQQVKELMKWKEQKTSRQISEPLDRESIGTLSKNFINVIGEPFYINSSNIRVNLPLETRVNDRTIWLQLVPDLYKYVLNATTDVFVLTSNIMPFVNGDYVFLYAPEVFPTGPIVVGYVVNVSGNTFQVSATSGGAAADFTDGGVGPQYIYKNNL